MRTLIREMNADELIAFKKEHEAKVDAEWKTWAHCSKEGLLREVSRVYRIHGHNLKSAKYELLQAIISAQFGTTVELIEKRYRELAQEGKIHFRITKSSALKLAQYARQITRQETDGRLIERAVTYKEMTEELKNYRRCTADDHGTFLAFNACNGLCFQITL